TVALSLTTQRISYERGDNETIVAPQTLATPFVLSPQAFTTLTISIPFRQVPADATGIGVAFLGKDSEGRAVHVETHLDVALPDHRTGGLLLRGMALTKMAAVGIEKLLNEARSTQPTPVPPTQRWRVVGTAHEPIRVRQFGVDSNLSFALSRTT